MNWLYKLAFEIGSQNDGYFGFSFRAISCFHIGLKIWKYCWGFGWWDMDGSDPERFPMINRIGWVHHSYAPFKYTGRPFGSCIAWRPVCSTYYGCLFNRGFYFSRSIYPPPQGRMEPPEHIKERNKQHVGYMGVPSAVKQWLDEYDKDWVPTTDELERLRSVVNKHRYSIVE